ncbi:MAG: WD40 repeat domain-containing protein [Kofleriaceae bacterium]
MVARGPGAVGCAHCKVIGAEVACEVCGHLVCPRCAADWTTCEEPSGREVRLGTTARLRDIDPVARLGLVTRWVGGMRLFDLRQLRWVQARLPHQRAAVGGGLVDRITAGGQLLHAYDLLISAEMNSQYSHMAAIELSGLGERHIKSPEPSHATAVSADDHYYYVSTTQLVIAIDPQARFQTFDPLPRKVVQAVFFDPDRRVLATGTWGQIAVHRVRDDGKLVMTSQLTTTNNLHWIAAAGPWLAACVGRHLTVWPLSDDLAIGPPHHRHTLDDDLRDACLSRDGRYLAIGQGSEVTLVALATGETSVLEGHTDDVCLVRFATTDHLLITADCDNRVILRPRGSTGYARAVQRVDVPDDEVVLAAPVP